MECVLGGSKIREVKRGNPYTRPVERTRLQDNPLEALHTAHRQRRSVKHHVPGQRDDAIGRADQELDEALLVHGG
eukprot:4137127-Prymnesium_polylepis.1